MRFETFQNTPLTHVRSEKGIPQKALLCWVPPLFTGKCRPTSTTMWGKILTPILKRSGSWGLSGGSLLVNFQNLGKMAILRPPTAPLGDRKCIFFPNFIAFLGISQQLKWGFLIGFGFKTTKIRPTRQKQTPHQYLQYRGLNFAPCT
jgi:hypothetical protein